MVKKTNPHLILSDVSWAIILACLEEFCKEALAEYLEGSKEDISSYMCCSCDEFKQESYQGRPCLLSLQYSILRIIQ